MRKKIIYLFLIIPFLAAALPSSAYSDYKKRLWWKNQEVVNKLNLSDSQVKAIDAIYSTNKPKIKKYNEEINEKTSELKRLIKSPDSTREQVLSLTEEINALESERHKLKVQMLWEIREVLNPAQREQLKEIKQEYMKNRPKKSLLIVEEFLYINSYY